MQTIKQRIRILILKTFFYELKNQHFTLTVYEDGETTKIDKFETILRIFEIYDWTNRLTFRIRRGNHKGYATFSFKNVELSILCMNNISKSLEPYVVNTIAVIDNLARKKHLMYELEQRMETIEAARLNEWAVISEIIGYLTTIRGCSIRNSDGSKLDMRSLRELHERFHDKRFNDKKFKEAKKNGRRKNMPDPICLKVIDADCDDGYIQFTAGNGFFNVITGYSRNLTARVCFFLAYYLYSGRLVNFVECFVCRHPAVEYSYSNGSM